MSLRGFSSCPLLSKTLFESFIGASSETPIAFNQTSVNTPKYAAGPTEFQRGKKFTSC
jgi:hypothetical protein